MPARTIAIGDVHGCALALRAVLDAVAPQPGDLLVPLGDYIDRGSDSRDVIEQLIAIGQCCRLEPLLGNHELMMLDVLAGRCGLPFWLDCGGDATLASYTIQPQGPESLREQLPASHLEFLQSCRRYFETERHMFVHANFVPTLSLKDQSDYVLFWRHLDPVLPAPHSSGKKVVVGHTPQLSGEILDAGHVVCIDTFCVGGRWLTALDVDSGQVWQADRSGRLRQR